MRPQCSTEEVAISSSIIIITIVCPQRPLCLSICVPCRPFVPLHFDKKLSVIRRQWPPNRRLNYVREWSPCAQADLRHLELDETPRHAETLGTDAKLLNNHPTVSA